MKVFQNGSAIVVLINGAERVKRLTMTQEGSKLEIFPSSHYSSLTTQCATLQPLILSKEDEALVETELCHVLMSTVLDCVANDTLRMELMQTIKEKLITAKARQVDFLVDDLDISELAKEMRTIERGLDLERDADQIKLNALKAINEVASKEN